MPAIFSACATLNETIDVPGLPFLPHPNPLRFDRGKWPRRIPPRVVLKLFDGGLELANGRPLRQPPRGIGRTALALPKWLPLPPPAPSLTIALSGYCRVESALGVSILIHPSKALVEPRTALAALRIDPTAKRDILRRTLHLLTG